MTDLLDRFVKGLGRASSPFGFAPQFVAPSQEVDPAHKAGANMLMNIGLGMMANSDRGLIPAIGQGWLMAQQTQNNNVMRAQDQALRMEEANSQRNEQEQRTQLQGKWKDWVTQNADKFGEYAGIAPYLGPDQGMKVLSGMQPDLTDGQREYQAAVQQGYQGTLMDFMTDMKRAGANSVNIDMKGEGAFEKTAGEAQAKRFDSIISGGDEASRMLGDIQSLRDIGTRFESGKGAEVIAALGPYADALGAKIDGLGELQAYDAIVSRMAPLMRTPGSGASSDFDARQFLKSLPALGKSESGNAIIQNTLEAVAEHKIKAAEIASAALRGEISREEAEQQIRQLPDPWTLWKKVRKVYPSATTHSKTAKSPAEMSDEELLDALGGGQ